MNNGGSRGGELRVSAQLGTAGQAGIPVIECLTSGHEALGFVPRTGHTEWEVLGCGSSVLKQRKFSISNAAQKDWASEPQNTSPVGYLHIAGAGHTCATCNFMQPTCPQRLKPRPRGVRFNLKMSHGSSSGTLDCRVSASQPQPGSLQPFSANRFSS